jgi:hypothetical protein
MTVHPFLKAGRWYLGRDRLIVRRQATFGERELKYEYNGLWSGTGWVRGRRRALSFGTEQEALAYIEANYDKMSATDRHGSRIKLA